MRVCLLFSSILKKCAHFSVIFASESYATFRHVFPASIAWLWRKYVQREIRTIRIKKNKKTAYLNIHGQFPQIKHGEEVTAVLLSHGDYGHPYTMLHLADEAKTGGMLTFSLYIPGLQETRHFESYNSLLEKALDEIDAIIKVHNGKFKGIVGVGHSRGSILFAHRQFVNLDPRIKVTCAIGGRLNDTDEESNFDIDLKSVVKAICRGITNNPALPVVQIVPEKDWCVPQEAMKVRAHEQCYSVPGMHLSALFKSETRGHFVNCLKNFS